MGCFVSVRTQCQKTESYLQPYVVTRMSRGCKAFLGGFDMAAQVQRVCPYVSGL